MFIKSGNKILDELHDVRSLQVVVGQLRSWNPTSHCRRIVATTPGLYADWSTVSHEPWALSIVSAYRVCEHLLTILMMWSLTDSLFEMVTPSILMLDVRLMPDSGGGSLARHFFFPSVITISAVLGRFSARLFFSPHLSVLSNSSDRLSTLLAGTMRYVSSAYLASRLPRLIGVS